MKFDFFEAWVPVQQFLAKNHQFGYFWQNFGEKSGNLVISGEIWLFLAKKLQFGDIWWNLTSIWILEISGGIW